MLMNSKSTLISSRYLHQLQYQMLTQLPQMANRQASYVQNGNLALPWFHLPNSKLDPATIFHTQLMVPMWIDLVLLKTLVSCYFILIFLHPKFNLSPNSIVFAFETCPKSDHSFSSSLLCPHPTDNHLLQIIDYSYKPVTILSFAPDPTVSCLHINLSLYELGHVTPLDFPSHVEQNPVILPCPPGCHVIQPLALFLPVSCATPLCNPFQPHNPPVCFFG